MAQVGVALSGGDPTRASLGAAAALALAPLVTARYGKDSTLKRGDESCPSMALTDSCNSAHRRSGARKSSKRLYIHSPCWRCRTAQHAHSQSQGTLSVPLPQTSHSCSLEASHKIKRSNDRCDCMPMPGLRAKRSCSARLRERSGISDSVSGNGLGSRFRDSA